MTQITLPPATRSVGSVDPPGDINKVIAALMAAQATSWVTPSGDSTGAADSANLSAAIAANGLAVMGPGTYTMNATVGPMGLGQWIICQPGVLINWKGTGDCFRFVDTSTYTTRTIQGGGIIGRPIIDGTSDGAGSCAVHAGDYLQLHVDVAVQNFSKSGDIGVHFDNQNYWTEQAVATVWTNNCTQDVVFDCGGALTSTGSFDRGDFTIYLSKKTFTGDCVVFQNGAQLLGGRLRIFGNINSSSSAFTRAVLKLTGATPGGHSPATNSGLDTCQLEVNVESDLALVNTFQTINFGSTSNLINACTGNVSFGAGNQFTASNVTTVSAQFAFLGMVVGDVTLNEAAVKGRLAVSSSASFFSTVYVAEIGSAPATPVGGGYLYVDAVGDLHFLGLSATDTILARHGAPPQAASVSYKPSNPTGTSSTTAVMMGLGSTCTFTPATTGKVRVTMCGNWYESGTQNNGTLGGRFGTGAAPANAAASTGTRWGVGAADQPLKASSTGFGMSWSITEILSLTPGTAYWFDVAESVPTGVGTTVTANIVCSIDELPS